MQWAVPNRIWVLEALAAVPFVVVALVVRDTVTVAVAAVAAVLLAALAVRDRVAQVRLAADTDGVTVIDGFVRRRQIPWSDIEAVRVEQRIHRGRSTALLEIDTGEAVYLLSSRELGAEPADVVDALDEIRP